MDLKAWLQRLEQRDPARIELGLERPSAVLHRFLPDAKWPTIVTVAGTNGKGTTCHLLDAILRSQDLRTGLYTSPHLCLFNERIRLSGQMLADEWLVQAFEALDKVAGSADLTYFEFVSLAAFGLFLDASLDVLILEVGLGGRLDVVNCLDTDCAIITSIDYDHQQWLGKTREAIAYEKAGIMRSGVPVVIGEPSPPANLLSIARQTTLDVYRLGVDFNVDTVDEQSMLYTASHSSTSWRLPVTQVHPHNVACALQVAQLLCKNSMKPPIEVLRGFHVPGRCQWLEHEGVEWVVDVAHNVQASEHLAKFLSARPVDGETWALFAALRDKDVPGVLQPHRQLVDQWWLCGSAGARGLQVDALQTFFSAEAKIELFDTAALALIELLRRIRDQKPSRVVAFGSFAVAGAVLQQLNSPVVVPC